jgi:hypothetical protein
MPEASAESRSDRRHCGAIGGIAEQSAGSGASPKRSVAAAVVGREVRLEQV